MRRRHGGDAGGGRGRARRGVRRDGDGRACLRGGARARPRPRGRHRAPPSRDARGAGCSRTRAGCPAGRTAGSATSWGRWRPPGRRPPAPTSTSFSTPWRRALRLGQKECSGYLRSREPRRPNGTQPPGQGGSGSPQPTAALTSRGRCSRATPSRCATCSRPSRPRVSGRSELVCVAGGARGDLLRQIRADVTGLPVTRPDDVETTARGAAMLAAVGAGLHADVRSASPPWPAPLRAAAAAARGQRGLRGAVSPSPGAVRGAAAAVLLTARPVESARVEQRTGRLNGLALVGRCDRDRGLAVRDRRHDSRREPA